ncbi:LysE family translocator [Aureimonas sp. AU22]|uniref:LysE family translocator n=1 Tax=Aureimonas sp. AU22 TaxID=1638162 RepID=UPI0007857FFE|nr:LysE family transporter [Aureimonas sp. AU22]
MHASETAADLFSGVLIGLSIAVPVGPSFLLCVHRCLAGGLAVGLASGLGIATVHAAYATLAVRGSSEIASFVGANSDVFTIASACLLFVFAFRALTSTQRLEKDQMALSGRLARRLGKSYASALLLGSTNPMTVFFFVAVIPSFDGLLGRTPGVGIPFFVVFGVAAGSFAWWSTVVIAVRLLSHERLDERRLRLVTRASAISLALVGLAFLVPVLKGWVVDRPHGAAVSVRGEGPMRDGTAFGRPNEASATTLSASR